MNKKQDLRWDDHYDFRIVESKGKFYLQREFMNTGFNDDGTYNPCISTSWNTLVLSDNYNPTYGYDDDEDEPKQIYIEFDRPQDALRYWKDSSSSYILPSEAYLSELEAGELVDLKVIFSTTFELKEKYPEALVWIR